MLQWNSCGVLGEPGLQCPVQPHVARLAFPVEEIPEPHCLLLFPREQPVRLVQPVAPSVATWALGDHLAVDEAGTADALLLALRTGQSRNWSLVETPLARRTLRFLPKHILPPCRALIEEVVDRIWEWMFATDSAHGAKNADGLPTGRFCKQRQHMH